MQLLGKWACADSTTRRLRDSIGRTLRKVTDFLHVPWNKFLVEASGDANAHATALALRALVLEKSYETWTPLTVMCFRVLLLSTRSILCA